MFDLNHVQKSPARFDFAKLESVNAHYIQIADNNRLLELVTPFLEKKGLSVDATARTRLLAGMDELKKRAKTLLQLADEGAFYARSLPFDYDAKARELLAPPKAKEILSALHDHLSSLKTFEPNEIEAVLKQVSQDMAEGKMGQVAMPLRAAPTGTTILPPSSTPPPF